VSTFLPKTKVGTAGSAWEGCFKRNRTSHPVVRWTPSAWRTGLQASLCLSRSQEDPPIQSPSYHECQCEWGGGTLWSIEVSSIIVFDKNNHLSKSTGLLICRLHTLTVNQSTIYSENYLCILLQIYVFL
jgi:hypothetical protein